MALDAAVLIRASSAGLFLLLGIAIAVFARRGRGVLSLAGFLLALGASNLYSNLVPAEVRSVGLVIVGLLLGVVVGVAGVILAFQAPGPRMSRPILPGAIGLAAGIAALVGTIDSVDRVRLDIESSGLPASLLTLMLLSSIAFVIGPLSLLVASAARAAMSPPTDREGWIRASALTALVAPYAIFYMTQHFGPTENPWALAATLVFVLSLAAAWLVVSARTTSNVPSRIALGVAALGLASYAYIALPANVGDESDAYGMYGILRIAGWSFLVYAILRADLLGVPLPRVAMTRGTLAAGSLATLFIVAQIGQNFLSARYGLLMGGIVAGAFLFAAQPLQRAMERMNAGDGARSARVDAAVPSSARFDENARVYKVALRRFLADGNVTAEEEIALAHLADELGLTTRATTELRHETEREFGRRT